MFTFARSRSDQRIVEDGRVACPNRIGDVDIDVCAACPWLHGIDHRDDVRFVRCRVEGYRGLPEYPPR